MGLLAAILGSIALTTRDIFSKKVAGDVDADVSTFASFFFALPFYIGVLAVLIGLGFEPLVLTEMFLAIVALRGATDVLGEGCKMRAFARGDISLVASFLSTTPAILLIASPLITGDSISAAGAAGVLIVVAGSFLLVKRDRKTGKIVQLSAILYSLGAALLLAIATCFDRLAVLEAGPVLSSFAMTLLAAVLCVPIVRSKPTLSSDMRRFLGPFMLRGGLEVAYMVAKLAALVHFPAPYVFAVMRVSLVLSVIAGRVLWREPETGRRLLAAAIILVGVCTIALGG